MQIYIIAVLSIAILLTVALTIVSFNANSSNSLASSKISSQDALLIIEKNLRDFSNEVGPINGVNYTLSGVAVDVPRFVDYKLVYVPIGEFKEKRMKLPLVYVGSNRTVLHILENGTSEYVGECTISYLTYCGYLPPFDLDYTDRLVYGAEILASPDGNSKESFYYVVDATNGKILDSTLVRYHMIQQGLKLESP